MIKRLTVLLAELLLCAALCSCAGSGEKSPAADKLTVWCTADAPITAALAELTNEYNALPGQSMPVQLKVFPSELAMAEAFNSLRPDLLLCSHDRASTLELSGLLSSVPGLGEKIAASVNDGFSSFSAGSFIPLGSEAPLMVCAPGTSFTPLTLSELADAAAEFSGEFMAVSSWADIFAAAFCESGGEFFCELEKDAKSNEFSELYNLFAELSYTGKLRFSGHPAELAAEGKVRCAIVSSCELSGMELDGCSICAMPDMYGEPSQFMSSVWGFAVTAASGRSAAPAAAFIDWLLEGSRLGDMALRCGLIPASVCTVRSTPLYAALFDIYRNNRLYMAPGGCPYFILRHDFDSEVSAALARLY